MDKLILDTTVLIDLSKGRDNVRATLGAYVDMGRELGVCAVSVAEFMAGVPRSQRQQWSDWIDDFEYWEISREAAELAGILRHDLARQGRTLHVPDALLAATAIVTDSTLMTNNVKDFQVPRLRLLHLGP